MTDRREEISLAEELFSREREDEVAVHPAVGVRIKQQLEERLAGKRRSRRPLLWIPLFASLIAGAFLLLPEDVEHGPQIESLVRAHDRPVQLAIAPGKQAEIRPAAALIPSLVPEVLTGEVEFRVATLPAGESFRVRAAGVVVEVIGTVFTVRRLGDRVDVSVAEGRVRIFSGETDEVVRAGETWSTFRPPVEASVSPPEVEPEEHHDSRIARILKRSQKREPTAKIEAPIEPAPEPQVVLPEQKRSLLALAAWRMRNGDLDGARSIYRQLSETDALGLYLLARLEAQHADRPEAALKPLEEFLARFADHELAREARASRIEALLDLARCEDAGRALEEFEVRHADATDLIGRSKVRHLSDCGRRDERSPPSDH